MKRSGFKNPGKPLERKTPMARGTATLKPAKALKPSGSTLTTTSTLKRASKPMAAVGARAKRTGQGKVPPTAEESAWMDCCAQFCIVCWKRHRVIVAAEVHHLKAGDRRAGHLYTIGLCWHHHQGGAREGMFISRHPWKKRFEAAYGTEAELLALQRMLIQEVLSRQKIFSTQEIAVIQFTEFNNTEGKTHAQEAHHAQPESL